MGMMDIAFEAKLLVVGSRGASPTLVATAYMKAPPARGDVITVSRDTLVDKTYESESFVVERIEHICSRATTGIWQHTLKLQVARLYHA